MTKHLSRSSQEGVPAEWLLREDATIIAIRATTLINQRWNSSAHPLKLP